MVIELLSDLPRKNCWTIAEYVGDATPGKMQHLLERARWDTLAAMGAVRAFVCERLPDIFHAVAPCVSNSNFRNKDCVSATR